mmetsp:Transcript_29099/g.45009  ORF Transcript_29099/g.45009 Transcript_29099/m.45009 type:complete len:98 (-) Transcript_29099:65-358(-)
MALTTMKQHMLWRRILHSLLTFDTSLFLSGAICHVADPLAQSSYGYADEGEKKCCSCCCCCNGIMTSSTTILTVTISVMILFIMLFVIVVGEQQKTA